MSKIRIDDKIDDDSSNSARLAAKIVNAQIPLAVNSLEKLGFKTQAVFSEAKRQKTLESSPSTDLDELASPTENAVSQIFFHTAIMANKV